MSAYSFPQKESIPKTLSPQSEGFLPGPGCSKAQVARPSNAKRDEVCSEASSHICRQAQSSSYLLDSSTRIDDEERWAIQAESAPSPISLDTYKQLRKAPPGHEFATLSCSGCSHRLVVLRRCKDRTCPYCRKREFYRLFNGYKHFAQGLRPHSLKFVTLTVKNRAELKPTVDEVRDAFKRLRRRKKYKQIWNGGIYAIECVNKGRGWNVHMHMVVQGGYVDQKQLSEDWLSITGDSPIVDIREAQDGEKALKYILKYVTKRPTVSGHEDEYNKALKGTRLIHAFGKWYGSFTIQTTGLICESCGLSSWQYEWDLSKWVSQWVKDQQQERGP